MGQQNPHGAQQMGMPGAALRSNKLMHVYRLEADQKRTWKILVDKLNMNEQCAFMAKNFRGTLSCIRQSTCLQVKRREPSPQHWCETTEVLHPVLDSSIEGGDGHIGVSPMTGHKDS